MPLERPSRKNAAPSLPAEQPSNMHEVISEDAKALIAPPTCLRPVARHSVKFESRTINEGPSTSIAELQESWFLAPQRQTAPTELSARFPTIRGTVKR